MEALMRMHHIIPWAPIPFQPAKKPAKPRKFFFAEQSSDLAATDSRPQASLDEFDDEAEAKRTDILA